MGKFFLGVVVGLVVAAYAQGQREAKDAIAEAKEAVDNATDWGKNHG